MMRTGHGSAASRVAAKALGDEATEARLERALARYREAMLRRETAAVFSLLER